MADDECKTLGELLRGSGCRMEPDGFRIKVVTSDGSVVLEGDIYDIRDRVVFNCYYYGDPIIHPKVETLYSKSADFRAAAAYIIEEAMGNEMGMGDWLTLDSDSMGWDIHGEGSKEDLPEEEYELDGGEDLPLYGLPRNRVGALQYYFQTQDIMPKYYFVRFSSPPYQEMFTSVVTAGNGTARGVGYTISAAKQSAAGSMLMKIQDGVGPDNTKANDIHGAFKIVTMFREPKLAIVTQKHLDVWGAADLRSAIAKYQGINEGTVRDGFRFHVHQSGDPCTMTPRQYAIARNI